MRNIWVCALVGLFCSSLALADLLTTKDGRKYYGKVLSDDHTSIVFEITQDGMTISKTFSMDDVESLVKGNTPDPSAKPKPKPRLKPRKVRSGAGDALDGAPEPPPVAKLHGPSYYVIPLKGEVGKFLAARILEAALADALKRKPSVVILDVNSPGGSVAEVKPLVQAIRKYSKKMRVVVFVESAISAAAITSLAAKEIYMRPGATIGAATAFQISSIGIPQDIDEKFKSVWRAEARAAAEVGGHEPLLAEAMIDANIELSMEIKDGKKIIKEGPGKVIIDEKGKLLAMTTKEAKECGLAAGEAEDYAELGALLGFKRWKACSDYGATLNEWWEKTINKVQKEMDKYREAVGENMSKVNANDPTQFTYMVYQNGTFTPDSQRKWRARSATCMRFLTKVEQICDKAVQLAEKYPQLYTSAEEIKFTKTHISELKLRIQQRLYKKGTTD